MTQPEKTVEREIVEKLLGGHGIEASWGPNSISTRIEQALKDYYIERLRREWPSDNKILAEYVSKLELKHSGQDWLSCSEWLRKRLGVE